MNLKENAEIVETLLTDEEVTFTYDSHFIHIQEHSEGGYEGSIYNSKEDYEEGIDPLDGGVCETIVAITALEFFTDISRDLSEDMKIIYIENEAKKGFRDWTHVALDFALKNYNLSKKTKEKLEKKIEEIK